MLLAYVILVIASMIFSMLDMLKSVHFRGYAIPARTCYDLSLLALIMISMRSWYVSSFFTILIIVVALFLLGLIETGFRNKLQNRLTGRLVLVIVITFVINLLLSGILSLFKM